MNKVWLSGNLVNNVTLTNYGDEGRIATSRIAVPRRKGADGKKETDFFDIKAFGSTAGFMADYLQTGDKIEITGRIQTRSYEKNGEKKFFTEIIVEECEIAHKAQRDERPSVNKQDRVYPDDLPF